ncbi:hypothetical protein ACHQM5_004005 [Ranunculus cassubicifolius]
MATSLLQSSTSSAFSTIIKPKFNQPSSSYKPTKITMFQTKKISSHIDVAAHIEHALSVLKPPTSVSDPMHHQIADIPRSMAPALCIAACKAVGGKTEQAIEAASAIHLLHVATFTNRNSNLPQGYELLAKLNDPNSSNPGNILRVIMEMSRAMGPEGMVQGKYEEMRCEMGWMDHLCEKKEGGLYACAAASGAILGGGTDEEVETLRIYGHYVGMMHGMMLNGTKDRVKDFKYLALNQLQGLQLEKSEVIPRFMNKTCSVLGL